MEGQSSDIGKSVVAAILRTSGFDVLDLGRCVGACPEGALTLLNGRFEVDTGRCLGTACRRCENACPAGVSSFSVLMLERLP
jgi:NAD-dependent dihydropyrimidine dehydrogenase PreA subunit